MQFTITLKDAEILFIERISRELSKLENREVSFEDAIHECIKMAMYDESEEEV